MLDQILGIGPEHEHTSEGWVRLLHPEDRQQTLDHFTRAIIEHRTLDTEFRIVRPGDGAARWMHGLGQVEYSADGQPRRVLGTVQDIPERRVAEQARQVLLDENTRLVRRLITTQEHERAELARELHDGLSQHLTAIRVLAGTLQRHGKQDRGWIKANSQAIEHSASEIYRVSHRLMEGLHPNHS